MSSDIYFNVASWFPGNVRVKPHFNTQCPGPPGSDSTAFIRKCILAEETTALEIYWLGMLKIDLGLMIYWIFRFMIWVYNKMKKTHSITDAVIKSNQNVSYFQNLQPRYACFCYSNKESHFDWKFKKIINEIWQKL